MPRKGAGRRYVMKTTVKMDVVIAVIVLFGFIAIATFVVPVVTVPESDIEAPAHYVHPDYEQIRGAANPDTSGFSFSINNVAHAELCWDSNCGFKAGIDFFNSRPTGAPVGISHSICAMIAGIYGEFAAGTIDDTTITNHGIKIFRVDMPEPLLAPERIDDIRQVSDSGTYK